MIRTFEVFYPEFDKSGYVTVNQTKHETPEQAIHREGDTISEWILMQEVFTFDCCNRVMEEGDKVINIGDSIDVILVCESCGKAREDER